MLRFESDVEPIFMLSMNMLLLLHLLPPCAFLSLRWVGVRSVSADTEGVNWEFIHEFGSRSRPCSHITADPSFLERSHTTNTFEKTTLASSGGKDNEFLCQVEEGDSHCFQKYGRQHWHGAGSRGQSSLKGQVCYREWTQLRKKKGKKNCLLLQRESFAFIYIEVDELILWLEVTLHLSWILPEAYCCLPDSSFLYNYKIMSLFIMSRRFEISVIINGRFNFYQAQAD